MGDGPTLVIARELSPQAVQWPQFFFFFFFEHKKHDTKRMSRRLKYEASLDAHWHDRFTRSYMAILHCKLAHKPPSGLVYIWRMQQNIRTSPCNQLVRHTTSHHDSNVQGNPLHNR